MPQKGSQKPKFQNFHFFVRPLCQNALRQRLSAGVILHLTGSAINSPYRVWGDPLNFGPRPPWAATPKKVFPKFRKNLRGGGQFLECAKRGPPRAIRYKILATVPWPIFAEKNSEISTKIDDFSSYAKISIQKNVHDVRPRPP